MKDADTELETGLWRTKHHVQGKITGIEAV